MAEREYIYIYDSDDEDDVAMYAELVAKKTMWYLQPVQSGPFTREELDGLHASVLGEYWSMPCGSHLVSEMCSLLFPQNLPQNGLDMVELALERDGVSIRQDEHPLDYMFRLRTHMLSVTFQRTMHCLSLWSK